jgi:hypothetical protein
MDTIYIKNVRVSHHEALQAPDPIRAARATKFSATFTVNDDGFTQAFYLLWLAPNIERICGYNPQRLLQYNPESTLEWALRNRFFYSGGTLTGRWRKDWTPHLHPFPRQEEVVIPHDIGKTLRDRLHAKMKLPMYLLYAREGTQSFVEAVQQMEYSTERAKAAMGQFRTGATWLEEWSLLGLMKRKQAERVRYLLTGDKRQKKRGKRLLAAFRKTLTGRPIKWHWPLDETELLDDADRVNLSRPRLSSIWNTELGTPYNPDRYHKD